MSVRKRLNQCHFTMGNKKEIYLATSTCSNGAPVLRLTSQTSQKLKIPQTD